MIAFLLPSRRRRRAAFFFRPKPPRQVWVLRRWDRSDDEVSLWQDEQAGLADLAQWVRSHWRNLAEEEEEIPQTPPAGDRAAVGLYYGPEGDLEDEGYELYRARVGRRPRPGREHR